MFHPTVRVPSPNRRPSLWAAALVCAGAALLAPLRAQDPELLRELQEIATRVEGQLREIDRLLLEAAQKGQPRQKPKAMLEQTAEQSRAVESGIDALIDKLQQMKNQSSSSSSSSSQDQQQQQQQSQQDQQDQQQQPQQQQQQRNQRNRRENQNPEFVQQPGQEQQPQPQPGEGAQGQPQPQPQPQPGEPGQQPNQPGRDGQPQGGRADQTSGVNRTGNRPNEGEAGAAATSQGSGQWGELQGYVNDLKNRGSLPKLDEKYRRYWDAYLKSGANQPRPGQAQSGTTPGSGGAPAPSTGPAPSRPAGSGPGGGR